MNRRHFLAASIVSTLAYTSRAAEANDKLRVGVIGHTGRGDYGHNLDTLWQQLPETEIVAVADPDAKGLDASLRKLKVTKGFAEYGKLLAEVKPDIVAISPRFVDQRRDMLLAAIGAGVRGIYVEKPFCRSPAEADEILAAVERGKVKLAVAYRNRYHPVLPQIAKLVQEGALGHVLEIRARGKEDQRGGPLDLWVLGGHLLNLSTVFAGKPVACSASVLQDGRPVMLADLKEGDEGVGPLAGNEVHARFEMERGIPVFFESVAKAGVGAAGFGIQIVGTKGIIDLRADKEPIAHLLEGNPFRPVKESRAWVPITTAGVGQPEPIADLAKLILDHTLASRDLISSIRAGHEPLCNAREGATTVEMICAAFESHRLGGQRVTFPLKTRQNPFVLL